MQNKSIPAIALACALVLAGCADPSPIERVDRSGYIDQRRLEAGRGVDSYTMGSQETFRMPVALVAVAPQFPTGSLRDTLPPTTVCVRIVITAQGAVDAVDALDDRGECHAGVAAENAWLVQAVRDQLLKWTYVPAAICRWSERAGTPARTSDCVGAEQVEAVPVSLLYAFTFEVREGKATVQSRGDSAR